MLPSLLTALLWSGSAIFAARSSNIIGSQRANLSRMILATALLALWAHFFGKGFNGPSLPWFLLSGVIGFGLGDLALFGALDRIGPRLAVLLTHCLAAPLAAGIEWRWLGTTLGLGEIMCALVILGGVVVALVPDHVSADRKSFWLGILFGVGSACGQGIGSVLSVKAGRVAEAANFQIDGGTATYQRICAGLVLNLILFSILRGSRSLQSVTSKDWRHSSGWVTANALSGPVLGVACFQWALLTGKTGVVMPIVAISPVITQLLAWWINGVRPTIRTMLGGIVAVGGVIALRLMQGGLS